MRKLVLMMALLIPGTGLVTAQGKGSTEILRVKTRISCDHCRMCESCGKRIENALYDQKGIKRVDVDDKKMEIVVVYHKAKTSPDRIRQAITAQGYDADELKAPPEAVAKLDGCCRGAE